MIDLKYKSPGFYTLSVEGTFSKVYEVLTSEELKLLSDKLREAGF